MNRKQILTSLLISSMLLGSTACNTAGSKRSGNGVTESVDGVKIEGRQTGTSASDESDDGTTAETQGSSDNTDTTGGLIPIPQTDNVLFMSTYYNQAWSYQARVMLITTSGDIYYSVDGTQVSTTKTGDEDIFLRYMKEYTEPSGHIDPSDMEQLYNICLQIDPDVKTTMDFTGCDIGENTFTYIDQECFRKIPLYISGDSTMNTDDPTLLQAAELATDLMNKIYSILSQTTYTVFTEDAPLLDIPYSGSELIGSNLVFDNYESLVKFCAENDIDLDTYADDDFIRKLNGAKYILVHVFESNQRAGGILIKDDEMVQILPSLEEYEHDPAFDNKITVVIAPRFDYRDPAAFVDENGDPWQTV